MTTVGETVQKKEKWHLKMSTIRKKGGKIMYRFLIVIEKANGNYSAHSPDLPGCIATGETREEVEHNMFEAIGMHLRGLHEDNMPIPEPHAIAEYIVITA
jgi:predicted RNase H-like HicB family nuclease